MIAPEVVGLIIAIVLALNAFLYGAHAALGYIKDKTLTKADNDADDFIVKILGYLQKLIEIIGPVTAIKTLTEKPEEKK